MRKKIIIIALLSITILASICITTNGSIQMWARILTGITGACAIATLIFYFGILVVGAVSQRIPSKYREDGY